MTMPDTRGEGTPGSGTDTEPRSGGGARGQMKQVKEQVVDQAKTTFRQARDRAGSSLDDSRRQFADQIGGIASAFHSAGDHLRGEQQERIAGLADGLAGQVDQVASYLRDADLQRLARDVEDIARRQPALVFGAAFAIGLLGARFIKSSESNGDRFDEYDEYESYGGYETIQPGGQPAGGLGYDLSSDVPPAPRTTGGGYAGA